MSQPHSSDPLPTVILVPPTNRADKRSARRKASWSGGEIPWMKIAIGGSVAWMAVILVVGLYFFMRGDRQPIDEGGLPPVPAVKPVAQEFGPLPPVQVAQDRFVLQPLAAPKLEELPALPANKDEFVDCEQIGVNVLFMKDAAEAFQRGRAEKKTVFIVHLSGNLEDKEFT
jgi:hypothetical protein